MRSVTLMTANQEFSKLVKEVEKGERIVITRRGRPIAELIPHNADKADDPAWAAAYRRMRTRMRKGVSLGRLKADRDELYDR